MAEGPEEQKARAKQLIAQRSYDEAIKSCRRILLTKPDLVEVRLMLGEALLASHRYEQVRVEMLALGRKHPDLAPMHRVLGEAYLRAGQSAKAKESLERAVALDPADGVARELLGEVAREESPVAGTIERWFGDEEPKTIQQEAPAFAEEEHTPVPRAPEASVQVDPAFLGEAEEARRVGPPPSDPPPRPARAPAARTTETRAGRPGVRRSPVPADPLEEPSTDERDVAELDDERPLVADERGHDTPGAPWSDPGSVAPSSAAPPRAPAPRAAPRALPPPSLAAAAPPSLGPVAPVLPSTQPSVEAPPSQDTVARAAPSSAARPFLGVRSAGDRPVPPAGSAPPSAPPSPTPSAPATLLRDTTARMRAALAGLARRVPARGGLAEAYGRVARLPLRTRAMAGGIAFVVLLVGVLGVRAIASGRGDAAIRAAVLVAEDDGRHASLRAALDEIEARGADTPWRVALRARLLATLTLEHGEDHAAEVDAALAALGPDAVSQADARIARSATLVAAGRGADALGVLTGVAASEHERPEAMRATAWAAATAGRLSEAEEEARQALSLRPTAPRYAAFEAVLRCRAGDLAGALALLDAGSPRSAAIRAARARVLLEGGGDLARAAVEAEAVLTELAPTATPHELGWAHLVRARALAGRGDLAGARQSAILAARELPTFDESQALPAVETLLGVGATAEATAHLDRLPPAAVDPARRASLTAEAALATGDLARAAVALTSAGSGAHADRLRGQLREAQGELEQARQLYERAASDPREALLARTRLGAVLLGLGHAREARTELGEALRLAPADPVAVPLLVRAALAVGDAAGADTALTLALERRPGAPDLLAARGDVLLALGRAVEALDVLQSAAAQRSEDAELRAALGDAARRAGRAELAASSYAEALRLSPTSPRALLGTAALALEEARFDEAMAALAGARSHGAVPLEAARIEAELAVARGLGQGGVATVQAATRAVGRDARLLAAIGELQAQAENDRQARDALGRALRADSESAEALLASAAVQVRRGDLDEAGESIDRAERSARARGLPASFGARILAARAHLRFERSDFDGAVRLADEAIRQDSRCADAHLVRALVLVERDQDPVAELRLALAGTRLPPEVLGLLVPRIGRPEACTLAQRYVGAAPSGVDRRDVDAVRRRCP